MKNLNIRVMALAIALLSGIMLATGLAYSICAMAESTASEDMSKGQYESLENNIKAEYRAARVRCNSLSLNADDICVTEAKGNRHIAEAELEANYKPSAISQYNARVAKTDAGYDVAREKCEGLKVASRAVCRRDAKINFNQ